LFQAAIFDAGKPATQALVEAPWYIVRLDDNRRARLDCIRHLIGRILYQKAPRNDQASEAFHEGRLR
jgi:Polyphosphate kinase 2 (PPK2)